MLHDIAGKIDFALAFAIVHEAPDKKRLLPEIGHAMKEVGKLLIAEPKMHVSKAAAVLLGKKRDKNKS